MLQRQRDFDVGTEQFPNMVIEVTKVVINKREYTIDSALTPLKY